MTERNLTGLRVLDFTRVMAGPYLNQMLCDLGADVIKVERLGTGADERGLPPFGPSGQSGYFMSLNRGKKSLALDLKSPKAREIIFALAKTVDVVTENFKPGIIASLGLSYEAFKTVNPRLIMCSISLFGQVGDNTDLPGYDINAQATSGLLWMTGDPDRVPMRVGTSIADNNAGSHALGAILAAVYRRDRTGKGQYIDIAMRDCLTAVMETCVPSVTMSNNEFKPHRTGAHHGSMAPYGVFCGPGGSYIALGCLNEDIWARLCTTIGKPEMTGDPRYNSANKRYQHLADVISVIETWTTAQPDVESVVQALNQARVPATPVLDIAGVIADKTLNVRNFFVDIDDPVHGPVKLPGTPMRFSDTSVYNDAPPPLLGQHTDEILSSLGYEAADIKALHDQGVVG